MKSLLDFFKEYENSSPLDDSKILNKQALEILLSQHLSLSSIIQEAHDAMESKSDSPLRRFSEKLITETSTTAITLRLWNEAQSICDTFKDSIIIDNIIQYHPVVRPDDPNILKAIKLFNFIGIPAFKTLTNAFHVSEFETSLSSMSPTIETDNQEVRKFLQTFREIQARKRLALTWGIREKESVLEGYKIELDVGNPRLQLFELKKTVSEYIQNDMQRVVEEIYLKDYPISISREEIRNIIQNSCNDLLELDPESGLNTTEFKANKIGLSVISVEGHAVSFAWLDKDLFYVNRAVTIRPGIKFFEVTDVTKIDDLLGKKTSGSINKMGVIDFENYLCDNFEIKKIDLMKIQYSDNCTWVAAKTLVLFAIYFNTIKLLRDKKIDSVDLYDVAYDIARTVYKDFSSQKRLIDLKAYRMLDTGFSKDQSLLYAVLAKTKQTQWQYRLGSSLKP